MSENNHAGNGGMSNKSTGRDGKQKWTPHTWTFFQKSDKDKRNMAPQTRSKIMAYQEPPKHIHEAQQNTMARLRERKKKEIEQILQQDIDHEKEQHEKLIGQLKAAESRNRIRIMRLRYEASRNQDVNHLIMCQPNARKAVRLQALLPTKFESKGTGDSLDKLSRSRVEKLLADPDSLITGRT